MIPIKINLVQGFFISTILLVSCNDRKDLTMAAGKPTHSNTIFPKGDKGDQNKFTGTAWLQMLAGNDSIFNTVIGNVTFEPGARTNWHYHPGGQILLVISGKGRYQEKGMAVRELHQGDVIKCAPGIHHWHGAAPDRELNHLAIGTNSGKGATVWLQPVRDEEYNAISKEPD